jgi:hypothetical protein
MATAQHPPHPEEDLIRRAFHNLASLRSNLPKGYINRKYADQLHHGLDQLERAGYDVDEWRVPHSTRDLEHQDLAIRLDAVLGYFSNPQEKIGFKGPLRRP